MVKCERAAGRNTEREAIAPAGRLHDIHEISGHIRRDFHLGDGFLEGARLFRCDNRLKLGDFRGCRDRGKDLQLLLAGHIAKL